VHSDFKPSNVFVTDKGEIKVLDLGIARTIDETQLAGGTTRFDPDALGAMTPQYASCEMFEGLTPTPQDDLYALACVIYEMLTGAHPFEWQNAIEARADARAPKRPRGLRPRQWKTLSSALAFSRAGRPASIWHLLEDLTPVRRRSSPIPWIAATVGVVVVAVVVAVTQLRSADDRFLEALLEQYAEAPANPVPVAQAQDWVAQGNFFVEQGRRAMAVGEYDRAASLLLVSPSSAFQSFDLALRRSDTRDLKMQAADGMLRISLVFRDAAEAMLARNEAAETAARTVCFGLRVNRFEPTLDTQLRTLNARIPKGVGSVPVCRELISNGTVSL
jgi:serine/threonine protein kinase